MSFTARRDASDTLSEMNITPLVDVMLVLLVIFMVTAPLMELRLGLDLAQKTPNVQEPPRSLVVQVEPGDMFRLDGRGLTVRELEATLAQSLREEPGLVLRIDVDPDADYQSAATVLAAARRVGVANVGVVE
jgi:biopolymer transport protein ExbD